MLIHHQSPVLIAPKGDAAKKEVFKKTIHLVIEINCSTPSNEPIAGSDKTDLPQLIGSEILKLANLGRRPPMAAPASGNNYKSLSELEKEYITQVLASNGGNRSQTAKILNINRRTLQRKMAQF